MGPSVLVVQRGPGVPLLLCLVCPFEVGSSRAAAELLYLVPMMSRTTTLQGACHCSRRDGDGDCKIVVACVGGRRSLVVGLLCVWVFCGCGLGEIPVSLYDPNAVSLLSGISPS
jgi:hypothetical protein